jgi:hypothetical protein
VIVLGRRAADYPGLGSASTRAVGGTPVTTVALGTSFPMKRWPDAASIQVSADEINPDGSIRLPISYHPLLRVRSEGRALSTRSDGGYLSVCCVRSPGSWLDIEAHAPPWLKWLYALSVGSLLGTLALFVRRRE